MASFSRTILHIDMDAFFAAVEVLDNPWLRGKPVIVGADPRGGKGRGVVAACSYEARRYGIHSALPISNAYRLCPRGIYLPPRGKRYSEISKKIMQILHDFSPLVEPISVDEAFLDLTGCERVLGSKLETALNIKKRILEDVGLVASVGVASNKFIAKIASDIKKPDGLVIVENGREIEFLHPLPISRLWGVGKKTEAMLTSLGIMTIGAVAKFPPEILKKMLGTLGIHLWNLSNAIDTRPVSPEGDIKSVGHELTFEQDKYKKDEIEKALLYLASKTGRRLRKKKLLGRTVQLKLRYENFETLTRDKTSPKPLDSTLLIYKTALSMVQSLFPLKKKVRLVGVRVTNLSCIPVSQYNLFEDEDSHGLLDDEKLRDMDKAEDRVVEKFGEKAIFRASLLKKNQGKSSPFSEDD